MTPTASPIALAFPVSALSVHQTGECKLMPSQITKPVSIESASLSYASQLQLCAPKKVLTAACHSASRRHLPSRTYSRLRIPEVNTAKKSLDEQTASTEPRSVVAVELDDYLSHGVAWDVFSGHTASNDCSSQHCIIKLVSTTDFEPQSSSQYQPTDEDVSRMVQNEARIMEGALNTVQGILVPVYHGLFISSVDGALKSTSRDYLALCEDGGIAMPDTECRSERIR